VLSKRRDDATISPHAFRDLEPATAWDQCRWRILEKVIEVCPRRAPKLQQIAETARRNQRSARAALLENGVGHDGRRMRQQSNLSGIDWVRSYRLLQRDYPPAREISGRRGALAPTDAPPRIFARGDTRKIPANIDSDPPRHATPFSSL